ncbi:TadE/TadG family type IV pilus assembly protein [Luteipulveratus mongoliensis]|uniref:Pilus assembly protein TadE n=1 Tax=Luteipulveratus mongoliensis TaxID=571913 RepID=A0A0K1JI55_9MICO|nr:pilus assembly protein [Luteipulveratus mongoliensis]AKU16260.1 pilus assembly protein TadE [Luteipulveratus mongoliensis]
MTLLPKALVRLHARARRDRGTAVIEFVVLGVLMTLPVFYLIVALARLQAGTYAVAAASREAGRTFVTASTEDEAAGRAQASARMAFQDQGFGGRGSVRVSCDASPCLTRDATVRTYAEVEVRLPLIPDLLSGVLPTSITVSADHAEKVDRFGAKR